MKRIKNIQELQFEKKKLQLQQKYLEIEIHENWQDLKENARPINIAKDTINSIITHKTAGKYKGEGILKNVIAYGASIIAKKLIDKAEEKLGKIFTK